MHIDSIVCPDCRRVTSGSCWLHAVTVYPSGTITFPVQTIELYPPPHTHLFKVVKTTFGQRLICTECGHEEHTTAWHLVSGLSIFDSVNLPA